MNYYAEALEICSVEQDWKKIVLAVAKKHPKFIVDAVNERSWKVEARRLYHVGGSKIEAIKYCRGVTGMGLAEAKAAVEALEPYPKA